jgi:hypothetical protein
MIKDAWDHLVSGQFNALCMHMTSEAFLNGTAGSNTVLAGSVWSKLYEPTSELDVVQT